MATEQTDKREQEPAHCAISELAPANGYANLPPLVEDVEWILGRPCFAVAGIARKLDVLGLYKVERKAEAEQAAALHWMLSLYLKHGSEWRSVGDKILSGESSHTVRTERSQEAK